MRQVQRAAPRPDPRALELLGDEAERDHVDLPPSYLEAALYAPAAELLRRPGKGFRADLVELAWVLGGGAAGACPPELPQIVEIIHAGSLIVDDVEDDADERRGAPAIHVIFGAPLALNTGNWMYFWALSLLERLGLAPDRELALHRRAACALIRCHRGQALDLGVSVTQVPRVDVERVVLASTRLKTGALMELAAAAGALAAGAGGDRVELLAGVGRELGVGLQMLDDIGSITCAARHDKALEDLRAARPTWAWAFLARRAADTAYDKVRALAADVAAGADAALLLGSMQRHLVDAKATLIRPHLDATLDRLRPGCPPAAVRAVADAIATLERSYD